MKVAYFNILADQRAKGFDKVDNEHLAWSYRLPRIVNMISIANPSIISLCDVDHFSDVIKQLNRNLGYRYKSIHYLDDNDKQYNSAILWKSDEYRLIASGSKVYENDQYIMWTQLHYKLTDESVYVFSTNLKAGTTNRDIRMNQVVLLMMFISDVANIERDNIILLGDMNDTPYSTPISYLHKHLHNANVDNEWTVYSSKYGHVIKHTVDYIMTSHQLQTDNFKRMIMPPNISTHRIIPNGDHPSDHALIMTDVYTKSMMEI